MNKIDFKKQNIPFTMVANGVLNDKKLSAGAKGLYTYLYSKPDNWDFASERIAEDMNCGQRAILSLLSELKEKGYLLTQRLSNGRMIYKVIYPPEKPHVENSNEAIEPHVEKATQPKTLSAKTAVVSNKEIYKEREESNTTAAVAAVVFSLKDEIQKLQASPRRELKIIGWFVNEKGVSLKSKEQLSVTIRRHLRAAKLISPFTRQQIESAVEDADRSIGTKWTLETLYKLLTK